MPIKFFINLFLIILTVIFQLAFIGNLPVWASQINLIIIILIFALEFGDWRKIIWWFLVIGFLYDLYSPLFFGFWLVFWPVVFLFSIFLSYNFFTNKSLYSFLGLTFFTTAFYYLFLHLIFYAFKTFSGEKARLFLSVKNFYVDFLFGAGLNLITVFFLFYLINFISDWLKPVFLHRK